MKLALHPPFCKASVSGSGFSAFRSQNFNNKKMKKVISKLKEIEERQIEVKHQYDNCPDHYTTMDEKNRLGKTLTILNAKIDVLRELLNGVEA